MTAIVGLVDNGNVYIGGDSAGVAGLSVTVRSDEKVFINGPFIIGGTSSFRMLNLLRYKLSPAAQTVHQSDSEYLCTSFIDSVRKCFTDNGYGTASEGGTFLVGYKGKLYKIGSDFQVGEPHKNFEACGCGTDLSLGSLFTSTGNPEDRVKTALAAAAAFSGGVCAPFVILKQESEVKKPVVKVKKTVKKVVKKKIK
jgi:hypothetical protein